MSQSRVLELANLAKNDPSQRVHIIGNLPFNVATPLLIQWLQLLHRREGLFGNANVWMTLMFQKEVAQRICAPINTSERGRLAVIAQTLCQAHIPYVVPSTAFLPKPKVRSFDSVNTMTSYRWLKSILNRWTLRLFIYNHYRIRIYLIRCWKTYCDFSLQESENHPRIY
jgi:16S rRNA A1518/A1519 N6-dimethyltransferase RsmA/KsgA/DIM1 with predicted DNA glycosylase/AP lyase activity